MSSTYIIVDTDSFIEYEGWLVKIGKSVNPEGRMAGFRTANPGTLEMVATIPGGDWERLLHIMLAPYRVRGEWFRLDIGRIALLATLASEHDRYDDNGWPVDTYLVDRDTIRELEDQQPAAWSNVPNPCSIHTDAQYRGFEDGIECAKHEAGKAVA